jgi:iron complex transport system substrate-binding protein
VRLSEYILSAARSFGLAVLCAYSAGAAQAGAPERVVSVNLCTDQLALMLAAPGQLVSVSRLAHDPQSSAMADAARALPTNGSGAEEIYLLDPDLVLAGTFTAPATVNMLRDLGIPVVQFAPAQALSDVPERILKMGEALGRTAEAKAMVARYQATLADLSAPSAEPRPRAVLTYVNSYSSGDATLAGDILRAAGFDNAATELGLSSVGTVSLEELILLAPDVIVQGRDYPGVARAEDNLHHPALHALKNAHVTDEITDRDWICGTPQVLNAVRAMRRLRDDLDAAR